MRRKYFGGYGPRGWGRPWWSGYGSPFRGSYPGRMRRWRRGGCCCGPLVFMPLLVALLAPVALVAAFRIRRPA